MSMFQRKTNSPSTSAFPEAKDWVSGIKQLELPCRLNPVPMSPGQRGSDSPALLWDIPLHVFKKSYRYLFCEWMYVCGHTHATSYVWRSILFFCHGGPWDQTQVASLVQEPLSTKPSCQPRHSFHGTHILHHKSAWAFLSSKDLFRYQAQRIKLIIHLGPYQPWKVFCMYTLTYVKSVNISLNMYI